MFGYVTIAAGALTQEQRERYRAYYCGLCHALKHRYGALPFKALFRLTQAHFKAVCCAIISGMYDSFTGSNGSDVYKRQVPIHTKTSQGRSEYAFFIEIQPVPSTIAAPIRPIVPMLK